MLYQTRRGIFNTITGRISTEIGVNKTKANPHGFINRERVMGFRRGIKNGEIPNELYYHFCESCYDHHKQLLLHIPNFVIRNEIGKYFCDYIGDDKNLPVFVHDISKACQFKTIQEANKTLLHLIKFGWCVVKSFKELEHGIPVRS